MRVLSENPKLRYLQVIFEDESVGDFRNHMAKSGGLAGRPIRLSDGRKVGTVIGGGAWPNSFTASDGETYDEGAPIIEMVFDSAEFMKAAKQADLTLEDDAVVLLGSGAGDRTDPVKKSGSDALRDELRAAWGL